MYRLIQYTSSDWHHSGITCRRCNAPYQPLQWRAVYKEECVQLALFSLCVLLTVFSKTYCWARKSEMASRDTPRQPNGP